MLQTKRNPFLRCHGPALVVLAISLVTLLFAFRCEAIPVLLPMEEQLSRATVVLSVTVIRIEVEDDDRFGFLDAVAVCSVDQAALLGNIASNTVRIQYRYIKPHIMSPVPFQFETGKSYHVVLRAVGNEFEQVCPFSSAIPIEADRPEKTERFLHVLEKWKYSQPQFENLLLTLSTPETVHSGGQVRAVLTAENRNTAELRIRASLGPKSLPVFNPCGWTQMQVGWATSRGNLPDRYCSDFEDGEVVLAPGAKTTWIGYLPGFSLPGEYLVVWQLGAARSNEVQVTVLPAKADPE